MIESALWTVIAGNDGVDALVDGRVYQEQAPQGVSFPFVILSPAGGDHMQSMDGASGVETLTVQVIATAANYAAARAVIDAVRLAIQGYAGTVEAVVFQSILTDGGVQSNFNAPLDSSEIGTFSLSQNYICSAVETKPAFA